MKTIYLLGELGKKFGRKHRLDVKTPAEAVRAFVANFPDFERYMIESGDRGVGYQVLAGATPIGNYDDIHNPTSDRESIRFIPTLTGAGGNGITSVLLGVALIAASFIPGLNVAVWSTAAGVAGAATYASVAFGIGVSLALGGLAQMLTPTPKASSINTSPTAENAPSYAFNGPVNVTAQGNPVPIGYGRMIVGSAVISAGIVTEEIPIAAEIPAGATISDGVSISDGGGTGGGTGDSGVITVPEPEYYWAGGGDNGGWEIDTNAGKEYLYVDADAGVTYISDYQNAEGESGNSWYAGDGG